MNIIDDFEYSDEYTEADAERDFANFCQHDVEQRTTEGMAFVRAGIDKFQLALDKHQGETFMLRGLIAALSQSFSTFEENWCEHVYSMPLDKRYRA